MNAMPTMSPTQDNTDDTYRMKALESVAAGFLAHIPKTGRPVSLAALTSRLWTGSNSQCRHDTEKLARALAAYCRGTGVQCSVKPNPHNKGDYIISLRY